MFIIPMVGLSSRFFREGYSKPKYQLPLYDRSVFYYVVKSFENYFKTDKFIFFCRVDYDAENFIRAELTELGVEDYEIIVFDADTRGQAETVYEGLKKLESTGELYIFNIDTIRPGFIKPSLDDGCDGFLEVFEGDGEHWSFVMPGDDKVVKLTSEKNRISNLCSDGLYFFRSQIDFNMAFEDLIANEKSVNGEFYIAPLYNYLIERKKLIKYIIVERSDIYFCGTPGEYQYLFNAGCKKIK